MLEDAKKKRNSRNPAALLSAVLIIALFFMLLNPGPWAGSSSHDGFGTVEYEESSWTLRQEEQVLASGLELPYFLELESGTLYTLSTVMTYDGSRDEMPYGFMHLDHMYCRVLMDGKVLFSYMPEDVRKWDASKSAGFIYKAFPLPQDCRGRELEIQLLPSLTVPVEYGLPDIEFGDYSSTQHRMFLRDIPSNIIILVCILLGISGILFSALTLNGSDYREGFFMGLFSLLFSIYLITECRFDAFYIGNPYYLYLLNYIAFSLLPASIMGFTRERLMEDRRKLCLGFLIGDMVFFAAELILHFSGILDMKEIVSVIHMVYFFNIALLTVLILAMKDRKKKPALVLQLLPVIIGMVIDAVAYWLHWDIGVNDATFTIFGVILFLVIEICRVFRTSIRVYTESVLSNLYRRMAYIDALTGAGNRRAYDKEIEEILAGERSCGQMIVVSADVNRLKYVNDNFGHEKGDQLICNVVRILNDVIGSRGRLFRTGGDEFAMFLYDTPLPEYEAMMEKARREMADFNARNGLSVGIAFGHTEVRDSGRILEAIREADRKMYADKARTGE